MHPILRLYEDIWPNGAEETLPALPRMIFVVHGSVTIDGGKPCADGETWHGETAAHLQAGPGGATCWRYELAPGGAGGGSCQVAASRLKLSATLETLPQGELILRGDSVAFPPGGCAYLHRHQGPGIRCLLEGGIRIDTQGHSVSYGPGGAWFETGPDAVFAQAADRPTRFIRVMILPRALIGKSSLQLVNEEDKAKPRSQQYQIFADAPITRPPS
jgi:hypothetical protein